MRILNTIRTFTLTAALMSVPVLSSPAGLQRYPEDKFEYSIPPAGSKDSTVLASAPSPEITIAGENKKAAIIVDLSKNVLYKYDANGNAEAAYMVASGKKNSPTDTGVKIVTHIETYPYRSAPRNTKRRRNPRAYGPKIICLNNIDPKTGMQSQTGKFIHGNNDISSLGKYVSLGCIRMDNEVIKELAKQVKRGDIVIFKR